MSKSMRLNMATEERAARKAAQATEKGATNAQAEVDPSEAIPVKITDLEDRVREVAKKF